ncbi:MAG: hypothetical protein AB7O95_23375, partial [Geminicoccaceae bacterium]
MTPLALALAAECGKAGASPLDQLGIATEHETVQTLRHGGVAIRPARRRTLLDLAAARAAAIVAALLLQLARAGTTHAVGRSGRCLGHARPWTSGRSRSTTGLTLLLLALFLGQQLRRQLLGLAARFDLAAAALLLVGLALGGGLFLG